MRFILMLLSIALSLFMLVFGQTAAAQTYFENKSDLNTISFSNHYLPRTPSSLQSRKSTNYFSVGIGHPKFPLL